MRRSLFPHCAPRNAFGINSKNKSVPHCQNGLTLARMGADFSRSQQTGPASFATREPGALQNQGQKYFRSPGANRLTLPRMSVSHVFIPSTATTERRATARATRGIVTSNARRIRTPQHPVLWGMGGGPPHPPCFDTTINMLGQAGMARLHLEMRRFR